MKISEKMLHKFLESESYELSSYLFLNSPRRSIRIARRILAGLRTDIEMYFDTNEN